MLAVTTSSLSVVPRTPVSTFGSLKQCVLSNHISNPTFSRKTVTRFSTSPQKCPFRNVRGHIDIAKAHLSYSTLRSYVAFSIKADIEEAEKIADLTVRESYLHECYHNYRNQAMFGGLGFAFVGCLMLGIGPTTLVGAGLAMTAGRVWQARQKVMYLRRYMIKNSIVIPN